MASFILWVFQARPFAKYATVCPERVVAVSDSPLPDDFEKKEVEEVICKGSIEVHLMAVLCCAGGEDVVSHQGQNHC